MEGSLELRHTSVDDGVWWAVQDEGYWRALMDQGEVAPNSVPPADPQEIFEDLGIDLEIGLPEVRTGLSGGGGFPAQQTWQTAEEALERGETFRLRATGANRGGLLVEWNGLQGFVPASHLKEAPRNPEPRDRASELAHRIGDLVTVRLIEVDRLQNQLVFSEREAPGGSREPAEVLYALRPGDICQGRVTNLTTFGAFVDLGGVEGLVHISEISWERIGHPGDVLHPGQDVEVYVLGVNPEEGRIALSLRRLRTDPWAEVDKRYRVGQLVEGTVTNVVNFGAFVRVEEGLEGLVHVSELADGSFLHPRNVLREGDMIRVRVVNVDAASRRLGLSLRQASGFGSI